MQYALILVAALHVLAAVFWAGSTFALARTDGVAMERLFKPQLAAAVLAFVTGGYLGHTLHAHAFGRAEQVLLAAIAASAVALVVQIAGVGRATLALRDRARDPAGPRALAITAHRIAAVLLALAAIGMATARYLPSASTDAAGAPVLPDAAGRGRSVEASPQAVAGAAPRPDADAVPVTAPAGVQ
ncbi:MAG: hypothetical protein JF586_15330 [Burkholderiales bacterium]|nr:hypothetical protein [Burkholderiales bacterium]